MWPIILAVEILFWLAISVFLPPFALIYFPILIFAWVVIVKPQMVRSKEVFGKFTWVLRQWLNLVVPFVTITRNQDLFRKNFPVEVSWVTSDNVTAFIWLNVIYYVVDDNDDSINWNVYKSIYTIDDSRTMIKSTIDEQLRAMIASFTHKDIFNKREEIWNVIEERLREKLSQFGYKLDSIQVRDVNLDPNVMSAMNKIIESQKVKEAAYNEAEAQKIMKVKEAEAEKESKILLWEGMAGQRFKIAVWFKESVEMIKSADTSSKCKRYIKFSTWFIKNWNSWKYMSKREF